MAPSRTTGCSSTVATPGTAARERSSSSTRPGLPDGYHEFRVVAIENTAVASQGRLILPVRVQNRGRRIEWTLEPATVAPNERAQLSVKSPGAKIDLRVSRATALGRVNREEGQFTLDPQVLGRGPVTLTAVAINGENNHKIFSAPIRLEVRDPAPF